MLHAGKIPGVMARMDEKGERKRFDLKFRKASTGELVEAKGVSLTSYIHSKGTLTLLFPNNQFRTIRLVTITEFNGKEVFL